MPVKRVISGGQVGADIAGLRAAAAMGINTGGYAPKGYKTLQGFKPELLGLKFGLVETKQDGYIYRTELNVKESDGTLRFAINWNTPGERATQRYITKHKKPQFDIRMIPDENDGSAYFSPAPRETADWIKLNGIEVLNIAGNAYSQFENYIEIYVKELLRITNGH